MESQKGGERSLTFVRNRFTLVANISMPTGITMQLRVFAALCITAASSSFYAANAEPLPLTKTEAMALPPDQLAARVLSQLAASVTSSYMPEYVPRFDLPEVVLVTRGHATDIEDICESQVITATMRATKAGLALYDGKSEAAAQLIDPPVVVRHVQAENRYALLGEGEEVKQNACDQVSPKSWFHASNAEQAKLALDLLHKVTANAQASNLSFNFMCKEMDATTCLDPRKRLEQLASWHLKAVESGPVMVSRNGRQARLELSGDVDNFRVWSLQIEELDDAPVSVLLGIYSAPVV